MTYLIGDQLELKRQYEQIQWLESFLKYQQEILHPSDYLNNWGRHLVLRNEILSSSAKPTLTNVQPDIKLEGKLNIVSESALRKKADEAYYAGDKSSFDDGHANSSKFRSNLFQKHNLSEKSSRILKSYMGKTVNNNSPTLSEKSNSNLPAQYLDFKEPPELTKTPSSNLTISVQKEFNQNGSLNKKSSLRPGSNIEAQEFSSGSPEKSSPEKMSPLLNEQQKSSISKGFRQVGSRYQPSKDIVEENDDEEVDNDDDLKIGR